MDCKDLMIGDLVQFDEDTCVIEELRVDGTAVLVAMNTDLTSVDGDQVDEEELSPIELTEEILVKNGFVKTWNGDWQLKEYSTIIISKDYYVKIFERSVKVDYVHELQHILHAACVDKKLVID